MSGGVKRDRDGNERAKNAPDGPRGRFHDMFAHFRDELDEHHDRRERIVKASRDVTAQSKKMCVRPPSVTDWLLSRGAPLLTGPSRSIFALQRYDDHGT